MPITHEPEEKLAGFCSAPWTDCITYANGELKACDRNVRSFGNWQKDGLQKTWISKEFQEFRKAIREGRYPDNDCASCHNNGTQRTAHSSLTGAYVYHYQFLKKFLVKEKIQEIEEIYDLLYFKKATRESSEILSLYFSCLEKIRLGNIDVFQNNKEFHNAIIKLQVVGESLQDYLDGELMPRRIAPFRQSQLQAKCTARCIMCAGLYTGEIINGPTMDSQYIDEAFAKIEDVVDFWCNGAEYLYYKEWKKIALMLAEEGTKLRISTNGILLTEPTIRFMVDNKLLAFLTISLDAATKETMESTRINVNFKKNMDCMKELFRYAHEKDYYFEFTAAFVMMKRNLHELPDFVRLVQSLRPKGCKLQITVLCQPLENFDVEDYRSFVHEEHHSLVGEKKLKEIFEEVYQAHLDTGIEISFYNEKIREFREKGMPFPKFFPRKSDIDLLARKYEKQSKTLDACKFLLEDGLQNLIFAADYDQERIRFFLIEKLRSNIFQNPVIDETQKEFPELKSRLDRAILIFVDKFMNKMRSDTFPFELRSGERGEALRWRLHAINKGDILFHHSTASIGKVLATMPGFILMSDGRVFPDKVIFYHVPEEYKHYVLELAPRRRSFVVGLGYVHLYLHLQKEKLFGNRKSKLLWNLSVAYRWVLSVLGLRITARDF